MRLAVRPAETTQPVDEATCRQQLEQEGFSVFRWTDPAGATYPPHSHPHDESLWVVGGEIVFTIGARDYRLRPGDRLMLPKGTVHTAHAGANGAVYLIGEQH